MCDGTGESLVRTAKCPKCSQMCINNLIFQRAALSANQTCFVSECGRISCEFNTHEPQPVPYKILLLLSEFEVIQIEQIKRKY